MDASHEEDYRHMARALALAERGLYTTDPNPRVGCVVVRDGQVVGAGWHARAGEPHAEVLALRAAGERARGATAYVTLEPCSHHGRTPPCTRALIDAGVDRVVVGCRDANPRVGGQGMTQLREAGIAVTEGVLGAQSEALNRGFMQRMRAGRPYVRVKLAVSLDGRTAMASGESRWITGEAARADVHRLRARSAAVVTGIGTVLADDPRLTARVDAPVQPPARVVLDRDLRMPADARMLGEPGETWVFTAAGDSAARATLARAGARVEHVPAGADRGLDLTAVLERLAGHEINEVMVEAGATLAGAFVAAGLADELVVYVAPHLMGDDARGMLRLPGMVGMDQRRGLEIADVRAVGRDWRITARPTGLAGAEG